MEHTSHQWPQGVGFVDGSDTDKPVMESNDAGNYNQNNNKKMTRPSKDQALNCPRCNSLNTKFCYYNNYSLTQPRYFCKTCRRYWTQGGSLRNVPVGGGSRKNKRPSSSSIPPPPPLQSSSASENYMKLFPQITFPVAHDLNLSYPPMPTSAPAFGASSTDANVASKGLSLTMVGANFMQDLGFSPGGFHSTLPEFKPATTSSSSLLNFSLARIDSNSTDKGGFDIGGHRGSFQLGLQEGEARVLFPTSNPKQAMPSNNNRAANADGHQQFELNKGLLEGGEADSSGSEFWNHGLLVGGSTSWIHGTQIH